MKKIYPHILLLSANLIYGITYSIAKWVMPDYIKPIAFVGLRAFAAMTFFTLFCFSLRIKTQIEKKDYIKIFICAFFGIFIGQFSFFKGIELTTPINASLLMTSVPVFVLILSYLFLKEKISSLKVLGIFIALLGAIILITYGKNISSYKASNPFLGNIYILVNALVYSLYIIIAKPLLKKYNPWIFLKWLFIFSFLMIIPFSIIPITEINWSSFGKTQILVTGFILLFTSCMTYLFNITALSKVRPTTVSVYVYSQPVFAAMIAVFLHMEEISFIKILSGFMIFSGVYLATNPSKINPTRKLMMK